MPFDQNWVDEFQSHPHQVIVDVRTQEEYQQGHIHGALWIPIHLLVRGHLLPFLQQQLIVGVYCAHGVRSWHATQYLQHHKVEVIDLGGIVDFLGELSEDEKEPE